MGRWTSGLGEPDGRPGNTVHGLVPRWGCWEGVHRTRGLSLLDKLQPNAQPQTAAGPGTSRGSGGWGALRIESCVLQSQPARWHVTRCGRCAVAETTGYDEIMLASLLRRKRGQRPQETPCEDYRRLSNWGQPAARRTDPQTRGSVTPTSRISEPYGCR